ncbi:MAG: 30S ribosomal protein S4 [Promethearchaeota archaeon]
MKKKYKTPNHPWERDRISEELVYLGRFGLRNKRELWKHQSQLRRFRQIARYLRTLPDERREAGLEELAGRLYRLGITEWDIDLEDVLNLTVEDVLKRRLQSIVFKKGLAKTVFQARQFIVHGHVAIKGRRITSPSHLVKRDEEESVDFFFNSPLANPDHGERIRTATFDV